MQLCSYPRCNNYSWLNEDYTIVLDEITQKKYYAVFT